MGSLGNATIIEKLNRMLTFEITSFDKIKSPELL